MLFTDKIKGNFKIHLFLFRHKQRNNCGDDDDDDDHELFLQYSCPMKAFSLISSRDHCQRSLPSQIFDTPPAGFEPAQYLSSGFVK